MEHSVPFGTFQILERETCLLTLSKNVFRCYNGSWVVTICGDDECDEDGNYRVTETSCQAGLNTSEYIQLN